MKQFPKIKQWRAIFVCAIAFLILFKSEQVGAQAGQVEDIVINFNVERLVNTDIISLYDGEQVLLPLLEVFNLLDLNIEADFTSQRFSGFVISSDQTYVLDLPTRSALVRGRKSVLPSKEFYLMPAELYLSLDMFRTLFDLDMKFNFSALQVRLVFSKDFPLYQKILRRQAQKQLRTKKVARRDLKRQPRLQQSIAGGVADWAIAGTPVGEGGQYYTLALGGMLMGGDLRLTADGNSITGFDQRQLDYRWHYYFGQGQNLTQLDLGKIYTTGILARQLKGGALTNRRQIARKHYQSIDVTGYLGNDWEVELYVNDKLTDFAFTDATGQYHFQVDILYGTTEIILKMYGPNGELKTERQFVDVPYSLLPERVFEYSVAAGVNDNFRQKDKSYGQAAAAYGIASRVTGRLTADIPLSGEDGDKAVVAAEITTQVTGNLTANVSVAPSYSAGLALNFNQPSLLYADASYTRYYENEVRNPIRQIHRLRLSLSAPFRFGRRYWSVRYAVTWDKLPAFDLFNMSYGTSASAWRFDLNYLGRTTLKKSETTSSNRSISELFATPRFIRWLMPQFSFTYDHSLSRLSRYDVQLTRRLFRRGQLNLTLSRDALTKTNQVMLTFRLLAGFADFSSRVISAPGYTSVTQVQRGSIRYDQQGRRFLFDRRNGIGYASAVVRPYLDANYNGVRDDGEPLVPGLKARIEGGRPRYVKSQQQYYYDNLQAYNEYLVEIDEYSLDNPYLKPVHQTYEIICNPNTVTAIELPVVMASEVGGRVFRRVDSLDLGVGGIRVMVESLGRETVTELTTFSGGDYYYLGFIPGSYRAYVDPEQLQMLGYESQPGSIEFEVEPIEGGTTVENIDFLLRPKK